MHSRHCPAMIFPNALLVGRAVRISSRALRVFPALGYLRPRGRRSRKRRLKIQFIFYLRILRYSNVNCQDYCKTKSETWRGSRFLQEWFRLHPPPENFEISSPRKHDFCHSEANSACFNISNFKTGGNLVMIF